MVGLHNHLERLLDNMQYINQHIQLTYAQDFELNTLQTHELTYLSIWPLLQIKWVVSTWFMWTEDFYMSFKSS